MQLGSCHIPRTPACSRKCRHDDLARSACHQHCTISVFISVAKYKFLCPYIGGRSLVQCSLLRLRFALPHSVVGARRFRCLRLLLVCCLLLLIISCWSIRLLVRHLCLHIPHQLSTKYHHSTASNVINE